MKFKKTSMLSAENAAEKSSGKRALPRRVRLLGSKATSIVMSAILVVALSPISKLSWATDNSLLEGEASPAIEASENQAVSDTEKASDGQGEVEGAAADEGAATEASSDASANSLSVANVSEDEAAGQSGISPASADSANSEGASGQLPSGTYWYNGDVSFTTIDESNGFTSSAWDAYRDMGYDGTGNALGIAGSFHLVAFDTLNTAGSHVYGNMLAKNMTDNQDFGTDDRFEDIYGHSTLSYIQNYQGTGSRFGATSNNNQAVVFGSNTDTFSLFSLNENNHDIINYGNTKTSATKVEWPKTIAQDLDSSEAPFIDLDSVEADAKKLSNTLASRSSLGGATYDFSDMNNKKITYTKGSGCAYVELSLSDLACSDNTKGNPIYINGVPTDGSGALVINVNCEGASPTTMPNEIILNAADGKKADPGETDADTGYVLWNFYNADGVTIDGMIMVSSILAPGATLNLHGNACGTFIADNINVDGETHTRPFHGKIPKSDTTPETTKVSVDKVWSDSDNADGSRPESVKVQLYADGVATGEPVELSESNSWHYEWSDLAKSANGKDIFYTVGEPNVPEGYTSEVTGSDNAFTITNAHTPEQEVELSLSGYSVRSISAPVVDSEKICYVDPKVNKVLVGRALADGEFSFQLIDDATGSVVSAATNDEYGMVDFDKANNVTGDDMNPCCLQFTAPGTYTYTVRENPSAAKDPTIEYSSEVVTFVTTIEEVAGADGKTALQESKSEYVCYASQADRDANNPSKVIPATGSASEHPTITNSVKPISLGLSKVDESTGKALSGAVYGLYRAADGVSSAEGNAVLVAKAQSDENGHMTFAQTEGSETISTDVDYWFAEISAPVGYAKSSDPTQTFQVKRVGTGSDTKYQLVYADGTKGDLYSVGTAIEFGDGSPVKDKALSALVNKVDSARAGISGAKLAVRLSDSSEPMDEWVSNGAGHVLSGIEAGKQYVLYEVEAPDGFAKAADVTFSVDEYGAITLVDGASAKVNDKDTLNAYVADKTVSMIDYKRGELVEEKVVQREEPKTKSTSGAATFAKTGDEAPVAALAAVVVACAAVAAIAAFARRRRS